MNPARVFADHVLNARWQDLPVRAQAATKTFVLDTLAVGAAGSNAAHADKVLAVAQSWGDQATGRATAWGDGVRLPAASAAFVNGFRIHGQEYDCVHEGAVVHPMATIGAALFAEAELRPVAGKDFLAAISAAVDVAASIGVAVTSPIRFFRPANAGLFGATLGIARLRGFDVVMALDAAGYALAQASGTMQAHVEGKPALPVQIGNAARAAMVACDLAELGMPGPHDVMTGPFGYFPLFELDWDLDPVLDSLGQLHRITEVSHKPWPTGRAAQGGIGLALALREEGVTPDEIEAVRLIAPPIIKRLVGRPATQDMGVNYARLCFQYSGALALQDGAVRLADFTPARLSDPATLALASRIMVEDDGSTDPAAFAPQTMEIKLSGGRTRSRSIPAVYGSPADPMSPGDIDQKIEDCLSFAGLDTEVGALRHAVDALDTQETAASILTMIRGRAA
jgi:2-methylcitrate dehydratase PrpD